MCAVRVRPFKFISTFCIAVLLCNSVFLQSAHAESELGTSAGRQSVEFYRSQPYEAYLDSHKGAVYPKTEIKINAVEQLVENEDSNYEIIENLDNKKCVATKESGSVTFSFDVAQAGFYYMKIVYYPTLGKGAQIERSLYIDGSSGRARSIISIDGWMLAKLNTA